MKDFYYKEAFTPPKRISSISKQYQYSGSVTFWYGCGSVPLTDQAPDPAFLLVTFKMHKKLFFVVSFFASYFFKVHLHYLYR